MYTASVLFALVLMLSGLFLAVLSDSYLEKGKRRVFFIILLLILSLVIQNYVENLLNAKVVYPSMRTIVGIYGYCVRPAILGMFYYIVYPEKKHPAVWILVGINAVIHLTALWSGICFSIDANNSFHRGPLGYTCHVVSGILLFFLIALTIYRYRHVAGWDAFIPVFNEVVIIISVIFDSVLAYHPTPVTYLTVAVVACSVFYYIWVHLQLVREHEKELRDAQRIEIMMSQIKPHFLYNSLGAIEELCESDPKKAKEATATFSRYLRGNMSSISMTDAIPFEKELSHTRLYLELEQIRFEDALRVEYDIACENFRIPALTLEPLAENAVRHGIRGNEDGRGTVIISTREYTDYVEVSVRDDGPGFDPENEPDDGRPHIGLQNVRKRLMYLCGGSLRIESSLGYGTTATIVLPKRSNSDDE